MLYGNLLFTQHQIKSVESYLFRTPSDPFFNLRNFTPRQGIISFVRDERQKGMKNCASYQTILHIIWVLNVPYLTCGSKNINSLHLCLSAHASLASTIIFEHIPSLAAIINYFCIPSAMWLLFIESCTLYIGTYTQRKWKLLADLNERFE